MSLRAFAGLDDTSSTGGQAVMMLDAQTLTGLDVLESGDRLPIPGAEVTCLWHHLDRASTPFGRRLLRWSAPRAGPLSCSVGASFRKNWLKTGAHRNWLKTGGHRTAVSLLRW